MFTSVDKMWAGLLMPMISTGINSVLADIGVMPNMTVATVITMVLTGFFVWLVPNKAKA